MKMINKSILNSKHSKKDTINKLHEEYSKNSNPTKNILITDFFKNNIFKKIKKNIEKEDYYLEDHDLYRFLRTEDFKTSTIKEIREIRNYFISEEIIKFLESITKTTLNKNKITIHSLKMSNTHYLLCHNDKVENRKIAFIYYLTELKEKDGGKFEFFNSNTKKLPEPETIKSIIPKANTLNIFEVTETSYHQITEILTDKERITIGGWYYEN